MVEYKRVQATDWRKVRPLALELIRGHRDGHITRQAYDHLRRLQARSLDQAGNVIWTAWLTGRLVGVMAFEEFGNRTSMVVVRRDCRGQGISKKMVMLAVKCMGRFYAEIAADNLPSLRSVFAVGMVADDAFLRRGKVILRVRNGFDPAQ